MTPYLLPSNVYNEKHLIQRFLDTHDVIFSISRVIVIFNTKQVKFRKNSLFELIKENLGLHWSETCYVFD